MCGNMCCVSRAVFSGLPVNCRVHVHRYGFDSQAGISGHLEEGSGRVRAASFANPEHALRVGTNHSGRIRVPFIGQTRP